MKASESLVNQFRLDVDSKERSGLLTSQEVSQGYVKVGGIKYDAINTQPWAIVVASMTFAEAIRLGPELAKLGVHGVFVVGDDAQALYDKYFVKAEEGDNGREEKS